MSAASCGAGSLAMAYAFPRRVALLASAWWVYSFGWGGGATYLNNATPYLLLV